MYDWISEGSIRKYHRAVAALTKDKKAITEEAVKELYVRDGGLVLGDSSTVLGVPEGAEKEAVDRSEEADAPKRRTRKAKE